MMALLWVAFGAYVVLDVARTLLAVRRHRRILREIDQMPPAQGLSAPELLWRQQRLDELWREANR